MKKYVLSVILILSSFSCYSQSLNEIKGYRKTIEVGYCFNANGSNTKRFEFSTTHGYQFNNHFFLGAGAQIDVLTDTPYSYNKKFAVPVYMSTKWRILDSKWTPIIEGRIGYSFIGLEGHYITCSTGLQHDLKNGKAIFLSVGAEFQKYKYTFSGEKFEDLNNGPFVKLGLEF